MHSTTLFDKETLEKLVSVATNHCQEALQAALTTAGITGVSGVRLTCDLMRETPTGRPSSVTVMVLDAQLITAKDLYCESEEKQSIVLKTTTFIENSPLKT